MHEWCAEHAPQTTDGPATWKPGDPLWHLSACSYWDDLIAMRTYDLFHVTYPNAYDNYVKAMRARGLPCLMSADAFFDSEGVCEELDRLEERVQPRPGTLDSLVLMGGRDFLAEALAVTAAILFPDDHVYLAYANGQRRKGLRVIIPERRLVLDMVDFFLKTRECQSIRYSRGFTKMAYVFKSTLHDMFLFVPLS